MLLRARAAGDGALACDLAALLGDRDPLRADGPSHDADLRLRLDLLRAVRRRERLPERAGGMRVSRDALARALDEAGAWRRELGVREVAADADATGRVVALAYPDRVGQRRPGGDGQYLLRNGTGAALHASPALAASPWLVVAESDGRRPTSRVYLAAALDAEDVMRDFAGQVERTDRVEFDEATQSVRATRTERLGAIVLREVPLRDPPPDRVTAALLKAVRDSRLSLLSWSDGGSRLRERLAFVAAHDASWPAVDDDALLATLEEWLAPYLAGKRTAADIRTLDLPSLLLGRLSWQQRSQLDALAPTHYEAPTGNRLRIDYADPRAPFVAVRLQEMFGCTETPRVLGGRVPVTLHLLSPAHRPVQVTRDLAGFWRSSYFDVRKDMKGRYPKHPWPDDPLTAAPTHRAKPRDR
jgi:ATP-dependent helicase HrpB